MVAARRRTRARTKPEPPALPLEVRYSPDATPEAFDHVLDLLVDWAVAEVLREERQSIGEADGGAS